MDTPQAAMSVDVDDLILADCDFFDLPYRHQRTHIRSEMRRLADLFDRHGVRATLFIPGYILKAQHDALDDVLGRGHEIACHGDRHVPVYQFGPQEFEDDLGVAIDLIRRATGVRPRGYRSPGMTLQPIAEWATPILRRLGFVYSSSVPGLAFVQHQFRQVDPEPFRWPCGLVELPVSTWRVAGLRVPVCGSVYTRLLPQALIRHATLRFRRDSPHPLFYYLHPFEVFPENLPRDIIRRHWKLRAYTGGCRGFARKLEWVLPRFSWAPYGAYYARYAEAQETVHGEAA